MAVPLPSKVNCFIRAQKQPAEQGMRLEYPGKKPAEVILETPPGHYKPSAAYNSGKSRLYHGENLDVLAALMQDETVAVRSSWFILIHPLPLQPPLSRVSKSMLTMTILLARHLLKPARASNFNSPPASR